MECLLKFVLCIAILFCNVVQPRDVIGPDDDPYPVKPEKCHGSDAIQDPSCCIIPPFYVREVARSCGTMFVLWFADKTHNITGFRREALNCESWKCILKKYGLLKNEDTLDDEKFYIHLDKWTYLNPEFTAIMLKAKVHCKQKYKMYMPLKVCEYFPLQVCIRHFIRMDCPSIIESDICYQQKEFYNECREYFL